MNKNISKLCLECNEVAKSLQSSPKEYVPYELMIEAKRIVDTMKPKDSLDALMYAVSLNLLNTYVKQKGNRTLTYYFKKNVISVLFSNIIKNNIIDVRYYLTIDRGMNVCYMELYGIVFSFHQVVINLEQKELMQNSLGYKVITFDNIRKQNCARSLFEKVYEYYKGE